MQDHPTEARISVVIPMFNAARFIAEALASVAAQTLPVAQIVVVDDGSTDGGAEIAERHAGVTVIRQANSGVGVAVNAGLARADGNLIAFVDADDRWMPEKSERQWRVLQTEPSLDAVFGLARRFVMEADGTERVLDTLPGWTRVGGLFRREIIERIGRFAGEKGGHDFIDWVVRAKEGGARFELRPDVVFERRIHDSNYGLRNRRQQHQAYFTTIRETLARRRAAEKETSK